MFGAKNRQRIAIYKPAACLGPACEFYRGEDCNARLELLDATGKSGGVDKAPRMSDCSYALYGRVCMGGEEQVIMDFSVGSPNSRASLAEMVGRASVYEGQRLVLNTPPEEVKF